MAGILYRCIYCETPHEVSRRTDGPVYLRCPTTYQWAWYDERAFELTGPSSGARRTRTGAAGAGGTARARPRSKSGGRRAGAARAKAATRRRPATTRRQPARKAGRKGAGRRGRR